MRSISKILLILVTCLDSRAAYKIITNNLELHGLQHKNYLGSHSIGRITP